MNGTLRGYLRRFSSNSVYGRLPARVKRRIQRQQEASEVLIAWVQLGVVIVWGILYVLAPKTFSADAAFAPVPWALGAYFLFTVFRLALGYRGHLKNWMLYLSVVVDIALLLGLIWSYHLQYVQPPSFYLKSPTMLYVFIFIALRALNFEVRYVALAGSVAALGWMILVWYVISVDPHDPMITKNYVEYMTSNSVLLGAEFDKIITILMVTAILTVAIARSRSLLIHSVVESVTARNLSRFVPDEVVRQITTAEQDVEAGQGDVREASILFTDIEGFTSISEKLSPVQLIATLNEYFTVVAEPIERYGGVINQFQGDAILATFNLPSPDPEHAANAIRAALAIQEALKGRSFGGVALGTRIGINTGIVVGGLVGTVDRLGYTVHGDEVNLAARLEQLNKDHGTRIIVSERTRELTGHDTFAFRQIGAVPIRGKKNPAVIYSLAAA